MRDQKLKPDASQEHDLFTRLPVVFEGGYWGRLTVVFETCFQHSNAVLDHICHVQVVYKMYTFRTIYTLAQHGM